MADSLVYYIIQKGLDTLNNIIKHISSNKTLFFPNNWFHYFLSNAKITKVNIVLEFEVSSSSFMPIVIVPALETIYKGEHNKR